MNKIRRTLHNWFANPYREKEWFEPISQNTIFLSNEAREDFKYLVELIKEHLEINDCECLLSDKLITRIKKQEGRLQIKISFLENAIVLLLFIGFPSVVTGFIYEFSSTSSNFAWLITIGLVCIGIALLLPKYRNKISYHANSPMKEDDFSDKLSIEARQKLAKTLNELSMALLEVFELVNPTEPPRAIPYLWGARNWFLLLAQDPNTRKYIGLKGNYPLGTMVVSQKKFNRVLGIEQEKDQDQEQEPAEKPELPLLEIDDKADPSEKSERQVAKAKDADEKKSITSSAKNTFNYKNDILLDRRKLTKLLGFTEAFSESELEDPDIKRNIFRGHWLATISYIQKEHDLYLSYVKAELSSNDRREFENKIAALMYNSKDKPLPIKTAQKLLRGHNQSINGWLKKLNYRMEEQEKDR